MMKKPRLIVDIETGPVADSLLSMIIPPFDERDVKHGNLKDPVKIAEKIDEARASHFTEYKRNAALNAMTGHVLAIGMAINGNTQILIEDERLMLQKVWDAIEHGTMETGCDVVGWYIKGFDLVFLSRRSYHYKIKPPIWLRDGRYWNRRIIDLHEIWTMGEYRADDKKRISYTLGNVATFLGLGSKTGSGVDFADLLKSDPDGARAYLQNDLDLTGEIAEVLL